MPTHPGPGTAPPKGVLGYSPARDRGQPQMQCRAGSRAETEARRSPRAAMPSPTTTFPVRGCRRRARLRVQSARHAMAPAPRASGYPNLNDDVWLWGGSLEAIHTTLHARHPRQQDDDTPLLHECRPSAATRSASRRSRTSPLCAAHLVARSMTSRGRAGRPLYARQLRRLSQRKAIGDRSRARPT